MSVYEGFLGAWTIGDDEASYYIAKYADRKRWALIRHNGGGIYVVAWFRSRDEAERLAAAFHRARPLRIVAPQVGCCATCRGTGTVTRDGAHGDLVEDACPDCLHG